MERWSSRIGFLLAAIGAAVGLGNIWRFSVVVGRDMAATLKNPAVKTLRTISGNDTTRASGEVGRLPSGTDTEGHGYWDDAYALP